MTMDISRIRQLSDEEADLLREALSVLEGNWLGHATRPSPRLYPHQWSWDAAFIAIGHAYYDQRRAQEELLSLFRGQWSNGMLPHIVFEPDDADSYFPGPDFWQAWRSPYAPRHPATSGIIQPPLHASAALHIYRWARDEKAARRFLADVLPRLAAWHSFLYRERCRGGIGLVEIWHPWESGMDNSPLWDVPLSRLHPTQLPTYTRRDLDQAPVEERPAKQDYDRYVWLVEKMREEGYRTDRVRANTSFAVWDVLYNSLLVQANRDLARIARMLGADAREFEEWTELTKRAVNMHLWNEEHATYVDVDVISGEPILTRVGAAFSPLYAGIPDPRQAERLVSQARSQGVVFDESTWAIPSLSSDDPRFLPNNYWRGPIWINVNWILYRGLRRYRFDAEAVGVRRAMLDLPRRSGFWEHYDPITGKGQGAERFAWTAALVLDLLFGESRPPNGEE